MQVKKIYFGICAVVVSISSYASTYTFDTLALENSTTAGVGASAIGGPLDVTVGEYFSVYTDPNQVWHGASAGDVNYASLSTNADGASVNSWQTSLNGINTSLNPGVLVASIGGEYRVVGSGQKSFTAWGTGELTFHYADINKYDNSGLMVSTVSIAAVPEPETYAMLLAGLGLIGAAVKRRKAKQA